ncbi:MULTISPECIES: CAP domain-containing protein [Streptomyces]|uniref:CAP domain-containing protein n=1 Tax=Streptomyces doebereineriae TaxID=3075528 RepID=A0ABU2V930_9ACTN|nr:CAP domain-containing protein [Streptomyces sp. DSM 41640]MDT0482073.1 CAP domain-containing protein [Streptomyces sp. DSM 41640]
MSELVPGGNLPLPEGAVTVRVAGPFDVSALVTDDHGKVGGDADFVFYNQPSAPGARLSGDTLTIDPRRLRAGASRLTVVVSPADPGTPLGRLPAPVLQVTGAGGRPLARFAPARPRQETVLLLAEIYRRGDGWKLRALGQGYADGLAGLARDFGVDVMDDTPTTAVPSVPLTVSGARPAAGPALRSPSGSSPAYPPPPARPAPLPRSPAPAASPDPAAFLTLVNSARSTAGSPPVTLDPRLTDAARGHASAMASADRLGAEGPDGVSVFQRLTATGYAYLTVGEHLVSGPRNPSDFAEYCLSTEQPRRTLHDPAFSHVGLAHATNGRSGDVYWTALWARPLTPAGLTRTADEVVGLTNRERARAGLPPLGVDPVLVRAAQAYSTDMAVRAFYSHTSPEGTQPWDRAAAAGSTRRSIGENIACGQRSAAEVVEGWMNSPGHRANILKPGFTHIGIGFAGGGPAGTYWTQLFGA